MSSNVNNSISNYIINTATKISKNVSGNNTIITGTINSSDTSGYKVSLYGGSDPITAAPLGTEVYSQGDNVYLWMIGSKGGDTHQNFTYYIIGKVNFQVSAEKVFLRESFQSNATGFEFEKGSNSLSNDNIALLKKYSAFKLSLKVNLPKEKEIENFYLRLFFKNGNDILGNPLEFSLGDCVGDLLSDDFYKITQEKVFFIGREYKDFTSVQMEVISNEVSFEDIQITPGIISTNAQDYSATISSYSSNDPSSVIKDYVLSNENSIWLKANVLFKTRDLFATGIQYYWQTYNNNKSTWEELNDSESRDILLEDSKTINNIEVIKADDNTFELKGENLTSYRNRVRCVIYYGAIEIISNELIIYNYDKSELKVYKKDNAASVTWSENNIFTDKNNIFKIEIDNSFNIFQGAWSWKIGGKDLKSEGIDTTKKYFIEINSNKFYLEVEKDKEVIKAIILPFIPNLFNNSVDPNLDIELKIEIEGSSKTFSTSLVNNLSNQYSFEITVKDEDHKFFSYYTGSIKILKNDLPYTGSVLFITSSEENRDDAKNKLVVEFIKGEGLQYLTNETSEEGTFSFIIKQEDGQEPIYKTSFEQKIFLCKDYINTNQKTELINTFFKDTTLPLTYLKFQENVLVNKEKIETGYEKTLIIKVYDDITGDRKNVNYIMFKNYPINETNYSGVLTIEGSGSDYFQYSYNGVKIDKNSIIKVESSTSSLELVLKAKKDITDTVEETFSFFDFLSADSEKSLETAKKTFSISPSKGADGTSITGAFINNEGKLEISYDNQVAPVPVGYVVPSIDPTDKVWIVNGNNTGVKAEGITPIIGSNGNWIVDGKQTTYPSKGTDGDSVYDTWLGQTESADKSEQAFLEDMKGEKGDSVYEIWLEQGNEGTEEDFLEDMVGPKGSQGASGTTGKDGVGITNVEYVLGQFIFHFSDGTQQNVSVPIIQVTGHFNITLETNGGEWEYNGEKITSILTDSNNPGRLPADFFDPMISKPLSGGTFGCWTNVDQEPGEDETNNNIIYNAFEITNESIFSEDTKIYANWAPHYVIFNAGEGTFGKAADKTDITEIIKETNAKGSLSTENKDLSPYKNNFPTDPIHSNSDYKFIGWVGGPQNNFKQNTKLTAQWEKITKVITFDASPGYFNLGEGNTPLELTFTLEGEGNNKLNSEQIGQISKIKRYYLDPNNENKPASVKWRNDINNFNDFEFNDDTTFSNPTWYYNSTAITILSFLNADPTSGGFRELSWSANGITATFSSASISTNINDKFNFRELRTNRNSISSLTLQRGEGYNSEMEPMAIIIFSNGYGEGCEDEDGNNLPASDSISDNYGSYQYIEGINIPETGVKLTFTQQVRIKEIYVYYQSSTQSTLPEGSQSS